MRGIDVDRSSAPQRQQRSDAALNRQHLLETARRILGDEPQASMASIAEAAGLTRNTIYRHFATRRELVAAVRQLATDDVEANETDRLRPAGELGIRTSRTLSVSDVLNKVPPFQVADQIVAEAHRLQGVTSAAIYLIDLDGVELRLLAGAGTFPEAIAIALAVGPEMPRQGIAALRASIQRELPGVAVAPMFLRGRATGVLLAIGGEDEVLRELAGAAAAALALTEPYTNLTDRVRRTRPTSPAAEIQQILLPPRIVRVTGAMLAGNVLPGYEMGGDWFDYSDDLEGTWLGLADTGGAGPRAAALAAVTLGAFRAARHLADATPGNATRLIHDTIQGFAGPLSSISCSATIALWDGARSRLEWVTCGPHPPLLLECGGEARMLGEQGPALGSTDLTEPLRVQRRTLTAGQRVLFASDGVYDSANQTGQPFGVDGVVAAVTTARDPGAATTVRALEDAIRAHAGSRLSDDATVMVLAPHPADADL